MFSPLTLVLELDVVLVLELGPTSQPERCHPEAQRGISPWPEEMLHCVQHDIRSLSSRAGEGSPPTELDVELVLELVREDPPAPAAWFRVNTPETSWSAGGPVTAGKRIRV
jgi:hypothetical protein